jgi:hypothetical protein
MAREEAIEIAEAYKVSGLQSYSPMGIPYDWRPKKAYQ